MNPDKPFDQQHVFVQGTGQRYGGDIESGQRGPAAEFLGRGLLAGPIQPVQASDGLLIRATIRFKHREQ